MVTCTSPRLFKAVGCARCLNVLLSTTHGVSAARVLAALPRERVSWLRGAPAGLPVDNRHRDEPIPVRKAINAGIFTAAHANVS